MEKHLLEVKNLSISFTQYERGTRQTSLQVIRGLDVTVDPGELVAVIGSSGSGKSLLAHAVMGILPYNASASGEILYRGEVLTPRRQKELRGKEIVLVHGFWWAVLGSLIMSIVSGIVGSIVRCILYSLFCYLWAKRA